MKSTLPLKVLILAASAIAPLFAVKVAHAIAAMAGKGYAAYLGGRPLPALTEALVVRFAGSNLSLGLGLGVSAAIVLSVATIANPRRASSEAVQMWQIFLAFIGPFAALVYLASTLIAALLPLMADGVAAG